MTAPFDFSGKTVFVAGGTTGINLGIARGFAAAGATVAVLSRKQDNVDAAVAELAEITGGGDAKGYTADVRDMERLAEVFADFEKDAGKIDVLVSGAAGNFVVPANELSSGGFRAVVEIDLLGTFHVLRAAWPHMTRPGGSVINISAPQSVMPMMLQAHVCAAKAGVDMLTRVIAKEWGPEGVRVNAIIPGPIEDTEGMDRLAPSAELEDTLKQTIPLRRYGTKDEIADMAMFLASPHAAYVTGTIIPVDGGLTLGGAEGLEGTIAAAYQGTLDAASGKD